MCGARNAKGTGPGDGGTGERFYVRPVRCRSVRKAGARTPTVSYVLFISTRHAEGRVKCAHSLCNSYTTGIQALFGESELDNVCEITEQFEAQNQRLA